MRVTLASFLAIAGLGALLAGCPDRSISEVTPEQGRVEYKEIPVTINRNIDLLFVIDDSPSMLDKQTNVKNNFPRFIEVLNTIQGGLPDVHIGVVSSDMGTKGSQDQVAGSPIGAIGQGGCSGTGKSGNLQLGAATAAELGGAVYISDIKQSTGARLTNYTGDLPTIFSKIASLGAGGCGFEQHLLAMRRALEGNPANATFVRQDAFLAVIFLADEDDCSFARSTLLGPESPSLGPLQSFRCNRFGHTCRVGGQTEAQMNTVGTKDQCGPNESSPYLESVASFVDFMKKVKGAGNESKVIVAGILGDVTPYQVELRSPPGGGSPQPAVAHSCQYMRSGATLPEVADPAIRIKFFLDQFPNRSTFTTICDENLTNGLQLIANLLKAVIGDPCIEGKLADVDPDTAGDQFDCSVSDVTNAHKANQSETILPQCTESGGGYSPLPCWRIAVDTANCPNSDHYILKIERSSAPAPETTVFANCVTQAI